MQLTLDVDAEMAEALQKEFATPNLKEAFSRLLHFYKQSRLTVQENLETIPSNSHDHQEILEARVRREKGEKIYELDVVINEFQ